MYFFFFYPVGTEPAPDRPTPGTVGIFAAILTVFALRYLDLNLYWTLVNASFRPSDPSLAGAALSLFLHGSWPHLLGNALYLVIFGRQLEGRLGFVALAGIFLFGGIAGCYVQMWFTPTDSWNYGSPIIGASGAIAALLGATLLRFHHTRVRILYFLFAFLGGMTKGGVVHLNTVVAASAWFAFQVIYSLVAWGNGGSSTAYLAHAGGFSAGVLIAMLLGLPGQARLEVHRERGRRYFEKGDWYAAAGEFTMHLRSVPSDQQVRAMRARCHVLLGRTAEAAEEYSTAFRAKRQAGDQVGAGRLFVEMRRYGIGVGLNESALMRLAFDFQKAEQYTAAAAAYEEMRRVFADGPKAELALIRRAEILWEKIGDIEQALAVYRTLLSEYPESEWRDLAESRLRSMSPIGDKPSGPPRSPDTSTPGRRPSSRRTRRESR